LFDGHWHSHFSVVAEWAPAAAMVSAN
jgi:hypothetical protein